MVRGLLSMMLVASVAAGCGGGGGSGDDGGSDGGPCMAEPGADGLVTGHSTALGDQNWVGLACRQWIPTTACGYSGTVYDCRPTLGVGLSLKVCITPSGVSGDLPLQSLAYAGPNGMATWATPVSYRGEITATQGDGGGSELNGSLCLDADATHPTLTLWFSHVPVTVEP